jgi:hypothetical protein
LLQEYWVDDTVLARRWADELRNGSQHSNSESLLTLRMWVGSISLRQSLMTDEGTAPTCDRHHDEIDGRRLGRAQAKREAKPDETGNPSDSGPKAVAARRPVNAHISHEMRNHFY